jgi:hypothetical protein
MCYALRATRTARDGSPTVGESRRLLPAARRVHHPHLTVQPHARFFEPMIRPVDQSPERGKLKQLSLALGQYLDSSAVCDRTDDDKTLVLLSGV